MTGEEGLDSYSIQARAFPIYITFLPIVFALSTILPPSYNWAVIAGASAVVLAPLSYLCRQIGGDLGKKRESALWNSWGGPPTTRFLRHGNNEFNQISRERVHNKLRQLGLRVPCQEEQEQNPQAADSAYESCVDELRRRTRDKKLFPLVFKGLTEYGFRRNIFALKFIGLTFAVISFIACSIIVFRNWQAGTLSGTRFVPVLLNFGLILVWVCWLSKKSVKIAADRYARFLLEASLNLEVNDGDNSLSER